MVGTPMNASEQESIGAIQTRVHHLEQGLAGLSKDVRDGFAQSAKQFADFVARSEQDRRPQWQAYGVMITVIVVLGGLVYWPIREQGSRIEMALVTLNESKISRDEFAITQDRGKETRERITADMKRGEDDLQRQIDELKRQAVDTYSLRDVVVELKQNQKEIQELVLRGRGSSGMP